MREKYRKSIASLNKFPQFTTMNVIDGQAGLISYTSLIFYSLTIDNILNIIVLLILAGITIATLTGENGVLTQANDSKEKTEIAKETEMINLAVISTIGTDGHKNLTVEKLQEELDQLEGKGNVEVSDVVDNFEVYFTKSKRYYEIDKDGNVGNYQIAGEINYAGDITKGGTLDGSEQKPYEINCIEDLVAFSNIINRTGMKIENGVATEVSGKDYDNTLFSYVVLKRNLNFYSKFSYGNSARTDFGDINEDDTDGNELFTEMTTGTGFRPIGEFNIKVFQGIFNGQGYEIRNLYENTAGAAGLFGVISANIKNLGITGNITSIDNVAGGITVRAGSSKIENCYFKGEIKAATAAGGIVGAGNGKANLIIDKCYNLGNIISDDSSGGIIGNAYPVYVTNCYNKGNIYGKYAGGILGYCNYTPTIYNSFNLGNIKATLSAGGIVGDIYSSIKIKNTYNVGQIESPSYAGGISGSALWNNPDTLIENSFYLEGTAIKGTNVVTDTTEVCSEEKLKSQEFVDGLNEYIDNNKEDTEGWLKWRYLNSQYPVIYDK